MHKFEDFMWKSNYEAFKLLVEAIRNNTLACYIGAGLSLYSKRWGEPFEKIVNELIGYAEDPTSNYDIDKLKNRLHELYLVRYSLDRLRSNGDIDKLNEADDKLRECYPDVSNEEIEKFQKIQLYPSIGDIIEEIMHKSELKIHAKGSIDTFNHWFCEAIKEIRNKKKKDLRNREINLSGRPYSFSPIYFLPYLGAGIRYVTTNCDTSFQDIGKKLHEFDRHINSNWAIKCDIKLLGEWLKKSDANRIFYIHGYISDPNSLVMSQRAYSETYTEGSVAQILQVDAVAHYTLLFLGASLENDKTVDVINQQLDAIESFFGEHCIPIFSSQNAIKKCGLHNMKSIRVPKSYDDISVILHQLIRETCNESSDIYSWKQDLNLEYRFVNNTLAHKIINLLDGDDNFKLEDFDEDQCDDILSFLYNNFLCDHGKNDSPEWTLCQIYDSQFKFEIRGPLHNYPLGNTIYILGGSKADINGISKMNNERANQIIAEIKRWIYEVYPSFEMNEKFSEVNEDVCAQLKIRIIKFPSPLSKNEQLNVALEKLAKLENQKNAKYDEIVDLNATAEMKEFNFQHFVNNIQTVFPECQLTNVKGEIVQLTETQNITVTEIEKLIYEILEMLPHQPDGSKTLIHSIIKWILSQLKTEGMRDIKKQNINEDIAVQSLTLRPNSDTRGGNL